MAKKIICKSVPELELCFDGGDSILLRFDIAALMRLQEEVEGGIVSLAKKGTAEMTAAIIYAGAKSNNDNYTLDDARELVSRMSILDITTIIGEFTDSLGIDEKLMNDESIKKIVAQLLNTKE